MPTRFSSGSGTSASFVSVSVGANKLGSLIGAGGSPATVTCGREHPPTTAPTTLEIAVAVDVCNSVRRDTPSRSKAIAIV